MSSLYAHEVNTSPQSLQILWIYSQELRKTMELHANHKEKELGGISDQMNCTSR